MTDVAAVYALCAQGGCLPIADTLIDRGATLAEVEERVATIERIRVAHPELAGEDLEELVLMFGRDSNPPQAAREFAALIAARVAAIRAGRRPRPQEDA